MFKEKITLQEYLSLFYVYLIALGTISDVIYFRFLNVDILNYSTILDVLISPINVLTQSWYYFLCFSCVIVFSYFFITKLLPKFHQNIETKKWYNFLGNRKGQTK